MKQCIFFNGKKCSQKDIVAENFPPHITALLTTSYAAQVIRIAWEISWTEYNEVYSQLSVCRVQFGAMKRSYFWTGHSVWGMIPYWADWSAEPSSWKEPTIAFFRQSILTLFKANNKRKTVSNCRFLIIIF